MAAEAHAADGAPVDWGLISFLRHRRAARAEFLRISRSADPRHLLRFLRHQWCLPAPGILLHVAGSTHDFDLPAKLTLPLTQGVVHAAMVARAWVITGGIDCGVMSLIGNAVSRQAQR